MEQGYKFWIENYSKLPYWLITSSWKKSQVLSDNSIYTVFTRVKTKRKPMFLSIHSLSKVLRIFYLISEKATIWSEENTNKETVKVWNNPSKQRAAKKKITQKSPSIQSYFQSKAYNTFSKDLLNQEYAQTKYSLKNGIWTRRRIYHFF